MNLKDIEVDGEVLQLPTDVFDSGNGRGTVIDSGTTLAYLPDTVYDQLTSKVIVPFKLLIYKWFYFDAHNCS